MPSAGRRTVLSCVADRFFERRCGGPGPNPGLTADRCTLFSHRRHLRPGHLSRIRYVRLRPTVPNLPACALTCSRKEGRRIVRARS